MLKRFAISFTVLFLTFVYHGACQAVLGTVKDVRDSRTYKTVKIGEQVWFAENLKVVILQNGDPIVEAKTDSEWFYLFDKEIPAWRHYNNDPKNGEKYGRLYNIHAAHSEGVCPLGWRVATDADWLDLRRHVSGLSDFQSFAPDYKAIKSTALWPAESDGNNKSGFNALPSGQRFMLAQPYLDDFEQKNQFEGLGSFAYFWGSSGTSEFVPYDNDIKPIWVVGEASFDDTWCGNAIRCIKK